MNDSAPANSCGYAATRMGAARCAIKNVLNSIGDAEFGLMQFAQTNAALANCGGGTCNQTASSSVVLQGISSSNTATLLSYVDDAVSPELCGSGGTPLGGVLAGARSYFAAVASPTATDTAAACRPLNVILLTDGVECCGGCQPGGCPNAAADTLSYLGSAITCQVACIDQDTCDNNHSETAPERAYELYNTTSVPTPSGPLLKRIKTYPIGFGVTAGDVRIENIAKAGHTNAPGSYFANYASDEATLSAALNQIVVDSQLVERCDGRDNDCDSRIDEDHPKYCDVLGLRTANPLVPNPTNPATTIDQALVDSRVPACSGGSCPAVPGVAANTACVAPEWAQSSMCMPASILCSSPGELCNVRDDDCDGVVDENAPAIAESNEICGDNLDNDCDANVDEDCNGCIAQPEVCDNLDQDCDTRIDETLGRGCGTDVGECAVGNQTCAAGVWGTCSGVAATTELCNNKDDDCDGVIDGQTQPCGVSNIGLCRLGVSTCLTGTYGSCVGNVNPAAEVCDNQDNDCDATLSDDGVDDSRVGKTCGSNQGVCRPGSTVCTAGEILCVGATSGSPELCDGLDNDCDGNVDEGVAATDGRIGQMCVFPGGVLMYGPVSVVGQCRTGSVVCSSGGLACSGYVGPSAELCDNLDQDCDGNANNGVAMTDPRVGQTCGTSLGECDPGHRVCINGTLTCDAAPPGVESCNAKDDDCDGLTDENLPPVPTACDTTGHAGVGLCEPGQQACLGVIVCEGEITQTPEICDNLDNDCDGPVDEGNPGAGKVCGSSIGECASGITQCMAGVTRCVGEAMPGVELCDGKDNDCDGVTDEGNPQGGARCDYDTPGYSVLGSCRTSLDPENASLSRTEACGECRFGTEVCQNAQIVCIGAIGPRAELCDGLDNDCDSPCVLDNSDPQHPLLKCPEDPCNLPESNPSYLDCDAKIDEGVAQTDPNIGVVCSGGSGECREGIAQCVGGAISCVGGQVAIVEVCNDKDDDCDTLIDEGFTLGATCGSDVGECQQGVFVCDPETGGSKCQGETKPKPETCDGLDNDCDGVVDNGNPEGGLACGSSEGECHPGSLLCVNGNLVCAGEKPRMVETCDCLDNDCDGKVDEDPSGDVAICGGESACVMCQCAQPCRDAGEFAQTCPAGRVALTVEGDCRCVGERCKPALCAEQTLMSGDEILCAPGQKAVGPCACKENECASLCNGVVCAGQLVCDATDGLCKEKSCLLPQFACASGQYCDITTRGCQTDPCAQASCAADQACRGGECLGSCANVQCEQGQRCQSGACVPDMCAGVNCIGLQVCDPSSGQCVRGGTCLSVPCPTGYVCDFVNGSCDPDVCLQTTCPQGQVCKQGECELRCAAPLIDCEGACVNPASSKQHCGASDDCSGDKAGVACSSKQVCSEGSCSDTCAAGFIACDGGCVNPQTDATHCGASGDCAHSRAGVACGDAYRCVSGECAPLQLPAAGSGATKPQRRVSVNGGGGCACSVPAAAGGSNAPWMLCIGLWSLVFWRRRLRSGLVRAGFARADLLRLILIALLALTSAGCKVRTFCLNCEDDAGEAGRGGFGNTDNPDSSSAGVGGRGGDDGGGAGTTDAEPPDGGADRDASLQCSLLETCNGRDDDCDGVVDEGTDPKSEGIDLASDVENCGACGQRCSLDNAFSHCSDRICKIDSCDPEFLDFDQNDATGCEYRCRKAADDDSLCNQRDDDCDRDIDEDVDLKTDLAHCGSCGNACNPPNGSDAGQCDQGVCKLDPTRCNDGFVDVDGIYANGCEYQCTVANGGVEQCNGADDDCDRRTDEGVAASDARLGVACGEDTGECKGGLSSCGSGGSIGCQGSTGPITEVCNGKDDDCDGQTDESFPQLGLPCGGDLGECLRGNQQCMNAALVCVGAVGAAPELCDGKDNDCDGQVDETNATDGPPADVGKSCVTTSGGTIALNPGTAVGECRVGVAGCVSGSLKCVGEIGPRPELCDDKDQDCNGNNVNGVSSTDPLVGASCGIDLGECRFGTYVCTDQQRVCNMGKLPVAEICNGRDDDCDGRYDETDQASGTPPVGAGEPCRIDSAGAVHHGSGESVHGECRLGRSVCSGGAVSCPDYVGPKPELCDSLDQDCDGNANNGVTFTDARVGQACPGNNLGECNSGTSYCNAGSIACQGVVGPAPELCDGLDNDCDGMISDDGFNEPTRGQICGISTGACAQGTLQCSGGSMQCAGQVAAMAEICDSTLGDPNDPNWDNDCDTKIDEDFQLATNVNRCGSCGNVCAIARATSRCVNGMCQIASCLPGYHDSAVTPGPDCNVGPCTIAGNEICNGVDDNCNGQTDEGLTAPVGVCNTIGACAGAVATCQGASGWVCSKLPVAERCNAVDDNCNGQSNEGFAVGAACSAAGVGACATPGTLICNAMGTSTFCANAMGQAVVAGSPGATPETCNGKDDDCDGTIDEPCPTADANCVSDGWVALGGGVDVYKYEASRPDSTASSSGTNNARACSAAGRLPWTNVTYLQALSACEAADPDGRLCSEGEWEQACMNDASGACAWGFPEFSACNTYVADQCNGLDYVSSPDLQPSGMSGASGACYRGPIATPSQQIFELSGNVKEYVMQRSTGAIPVRGGASNNAGDGLRCDFDFPVWPDNSPFPNVGFRCCRSASVCSTFELTGVDITHATLATSSISVSALGPITDVNVVNFRGTHNTMSQVDYMELVGPDNTTVRLTNSAYCGTSNNWSYAFDQESATLLPPTTGSPCGAGNVRRPFASLAAFNSKSAVGTWSIRVHDSSSGGSTSSPHINSWGVRICVDPS